jgi:predicted dehydrogenase
MSLRLGLIGLSPGNGHPYSWAAICNGYDPDILRGSGFPVIGEYLAQQQWPKARLSDATVTHVWTHDPTRSAHIAAATLIKSIVSHPEDMIGHIDGLLLARDDAQNHRSFAAPFLAAGLPVYVDKPVALSVASLDALYALERYDGQIFTCSALRYAHEFLLPPERLQALGPLRLIQAMTPKSWDLYAIHLIDPLLKLIGHDLTPMRLFAGPAGLDGRQLGLQYPQGLTVSLTALGPQVRGPLSLRLHGETDWCDLVFSDSFSAFRAALADFIRGIRAQSVQSPPAFNRKAIEILEMGRLE